MPERTIELKEGYELLEGKSGGNPIKWLGIKGPAEIVIRTPEPPVTISVGKVEKILVTAWKESESESQMYIKAVDMLRAAAKEKSDE